MKIRLICVGKNSMNFVDVGVNEYLGRIKKYISFEMVFAKSVKKPKSLDIKSIKQQESAMVLNLLGGGEAVYLLDEKGKQLSSLEFASFFKKEMIKSTKEIAFVIGGAFGFSEALYNRANGSISLSRMTFSHQMVRVFFLEQVYRAFTILNNEPYHNE